MSSTQYAIYRKQTFNLAKTLIIKLDEVSLGINNELALMGKPLYDTQMRDQFPYVPIEAFYKYYQNLSGQYHISDMEKLTETTGNPFMKITLIGNNGTYEVDFTKELLEKDLSVANEYRFDSYYYNELVGRYPNFEPLILGILYPVKLELAVAAKNGEILYVGGYIKDYLPNSKETGYIETNKVTSNGVIEPQEINLIPELQKWIDKYVFRWTNIEYALTDDLYVAASTSVMYMQIPAVVMNIRFENCFTPYAHTFHIKEYLESHGRLGHVIENLPIEASLWLYRNMNYYEDNMGKEFVLRDIVDNIFTPTKIPLTGYDTTHNVGLMPDNILPKAALVKDVLNFESLAASSADKTINSVLLDGIVSGRDNERDLRDAHVRITDKIQYGGDDTLSTKVLESEMLSLPGRYPFTLTDTLLNLWLYSIDESDTVNKSLDGAVFITNPLTGARVAMSLTDAYKVALYCFNKGASGLELIRPPGPEELRARMIPRSFTYRPTPEHKYKPDAVTLWGYTHKSTPEEIANVYSKIEWRRHFTSSTMLNETGTELFLEMVRQFNCYTAAEDMFARAEVELCMNRHYWAAIPCTVTIPVDYPIWLEQIGLSLDGLTGENLIDLGLELVTVSTGLDLTLSKRRADSQRAAIDVLKHFTSYTVQILDSVSFDTGLPTDAKILRVSNLTHTLKRSSLGKCILGFDATISAKMRFSRIYEEFGKGIAFVSSSREHFKYEYDTQHVKISPGKMTYKARIELPAFTITRADLDIPNYISPEIPPAPVTEATDLTYYASEKYPDPNQTDDE